MRLKGNPLAEAGAFFGLTLGLSYLVFWGPLALFRVPTISFVGKTVGPAWALALYVVGGFVPSLAALFLTAVWEGKPGLRRLGRRVVQVDIGWRWYLAIVAVVVLGAAAEILINALLGHTFPMRLFLAQLGSALPLIVLGPLSEELGWRGYALDRLQARCSALVSALLVGVAWALWHLPLFHMVGTSQRELGMSFVGFAVALTASSVVYTWLHNHTGGSVWTAILFHWLYTYATQVLASGVLRGPAYNWLEPVPWVIIATVIVVVWGPARLRKPQEVRR